MNYIQLTRFFFFLIAKYVFGIHDYNDNGKCQNKNLLKYGRFFHSNSVEYLKIPVYSYFLFKSDFLCYTMQKK